MVVPGVKHEFTDGVREDMFQFFGAAMLNCNL